VSASSLIEHGLDLIWRASQPEPNRSFIDLPAQVTSTVNLFGFIVVESDGCGERTVVTC